MLYFDDLQTACRLLKVFMALLPPSCLTAAAQIGKGLCAGKGLVIKQDCCWSIHVQGHDLRFSDADLQPYLLSKFAETACLLLPVSRSGELRTQKLKSHMLRKRSLKVVPLKPGVGQYIAMHATLTARDFFLAGCRFPC